MINTNKLKHQYDYQTIHTRTEKNVELTDGALFVFIFLITLEKRFSPHHIRSMNSVDS